MAKTRSLQVTISGDAKGLSRAFGQAGDDAEKMGARVSRVGARSAKALAGIGVAGGVAAAAGLKKSAEAAIEAEKSQARLEAQLKASGISYADHAKQIDKSIQATSKLAGLDDEDLADSFTNIVRVTGDVNEALKLNGLAADFARGKQIEVAKAGEIVGKVAGGNVGVLGRYGIKVKEGATAQEALALLQQKFAGQAEAYGKTTAGSLDRVSVASENLGEIIGARVTPHLAKAATGLLNMIDKAGKLAGPLRQATGSVADFGQRVSSAFDGGNKDATRYARTVRGAATDALAGLRGMGRSVARIFDGVGSDLRDIGRALVRFSTAFAQAATFVARRFAPMIQNVVESVAGIVRGFIKLVAGLLTGNWGKAWDGAKQVVVSAVRGIVAIITGLGDQMRAAMGAVARAMIRGLVAGLRGLGGAIKNAVISGVKAGVGAAKGAVGDVIGGLNPFGDGIGKLARSIGDGVGRGPVVSGGGGGGSANLMGADSDLSPFAAAGAALGLRVSSGARPGSITSSGNASYHGSGDAIDMAGSPSAMLAYARMMRQRFGPRLRELIYTPMGVGIKDGKPYRYTGAVAADHHDHVHIAYTGAFSGGGRRALTGDGIGDAVRAARSVGLSGEQLVQMVAIAGAESGYDAQINAAGPEDSRGLWQINVGPGANTDMLRLGNLYNPMVNAKAMKQILARQGLTAWSVYTNGAYRGYLDRARQAVAGGGGSGGGGGSSISGGGGSRPRVASTRSTLGAAGGGGFGFGLLPGSTQDLEQRVSQGELAIATAGDDRGKMERAIALKRDAISKRATKIRTALQDDDRYRASRGKRGKRLTAATRIRLEAELAQLIQDARSLDAEVGELRAAPVAEAAEASRLGAEAATEARDKAAEAAAAAAQHVIDVEDAALAEAGLTETTDDDRAALSTRLSRQSADLDAARASGDPRRVVEAINAWKATKDALTQLAEATNDNAQAMKDHTAALSGVRDELKRSNDIATAVQSTDAFQLKRTLADLVSGEIVGRGVTGRSFTAGTGVAYAY